jgi:Holliday junction resolvasome RuvABC ATP-dependent DNA helicase subunit
LLEELRLLGNLEASSGKALQILLVAQPTLLATMRSAELAALWQRTAIRVELEPLALQEAADYLLHHVRVAGGRPERLFSDEALELLAHQTHGVPRLLNQAAHQALHLTAETGSAQVDAEAALEALTMLGLTDEGQDAGRLARLEGVPAPLTSEAKPTDNDDEIPDSEGTPSNTEEPGSCRLVLASGLTN